MKKLLIICEDSKSLILTRKEIVVFLICSGYQCDVAVPRDGCCEELKELGCNVISIDFNRRGINPLTDLKLLGRYRKLIKKKAYDFIITYSIKPNIYGGFAARFLRIPYYINITGLGSALSRPGILRMIAIILYKLSAPKARGIFFENEANRKRFINWRLCTAEKSYTLPGAGINLDEFAFSERIPEDRLVFLFIGRLMDEKGVNELCKAAKKIFAVYPKTLFKFAGRFEGAFKEKFDELYAKTPNVEYIGYCDNIREQIINADCVILPSYHEGMANVLLEGGAIGRPLLASNIPGCREIVVDNYNGFTFEPKSTDAVCEAIEKFISLSKKDRIVYGENSRRHIEQNFDRNIVVTRITGILLEK